MIYPWLKLTKLIRGQSRRSLKSNSTNCQILSSQQLFKWLKQKYWTNPTPTATRVHHAQPLSTNLRFCLLTRKCVKKGRPAIRERVIITTRVRDKKKLARRSMRIYSRDWKKNLWLKTLRKLPWKEKRKRTTKNKKINRKVMKKKKMKKKNVLLSRTKT